MAKYFGKIGFAETVETRPGVWTEEITTREYYGDVIKNYDRLQTPSETLNDNVQISNTISIIADAYAYNHFHSIRFLEWMGVKWKVSSIDVQHPRLQLTLGGLYHDEQTSGTP